MAILQGGLGAQHLFSVFLGLTLHAIGLASLGLVCSAYTRSQLIAAVASWAVGFVLWDFGWASNFVNEGTARFLDGISLHLRYGSFAEGIVNLANLVYFVGLGLVAFAITRFSFDWRRVAG
jgi:ABC-2 type transport system permease protein